MPDTRTPAELAAWARGLLEVVDPETAPPWEPDGEEVLDYTGALVADAYHDGDAAMMAAAPELADAVADLAVDNQQLREALEMVRALATDQMRMHRVNGDSMGAWSRIASILQQCNVLEGK